MGKKCDKNLSPRVVPLVFSVHFPIAARARGPRMPAVSPARPAPTPAVVLISPYLTRLFPPLPLWE